MTRLHQRARPSSPANRGRRVSGPIALDRRLRPRAPSDLSGLILYGQA